jgi:hypothetical protein
VEKRWRVGGGNGARGRAEMRGEECRGGRDIKKEGMGKVE